MKYWYTWKILKALQHDWIHTVLKWSLNNKQVINNHVIEAATSQA